VEEGWGWVEKGVRLLATGVRKTQDAGKSGMGERLKKLKKLKKLKRLKRERRTHDARRTTQGRRPEYQKSSVTALVFCPPSRGVGG